MTRQHLYRNPQDYVRAKNILVNLVYICSVLYLDIEFKHTLSAWFNFWISGSCIWNPNKILMQTYIQQIYCLDQNEYLTFFFLKQVHYHSPILKCFQLQLPLSHKTYIILGSVPIQGRVESAAVYYQKAHIYKLSLTFLH